MEDEEEFSNEIECLLAAGLVAVLFMAIRWFVYHLGD